MKKIGLLFPGQGAQYVGMGLNLFTMYEAAAGIYKSAEGILGYDIKDICFNGPEEKLKQTEICQPALFIHSMILFSLFKELGIPYHSAAGHSLGEFSALSAAGIVDFEEGLKLVKKRGELVRDASSDHPGSMAAIIGLESEKVQEICREIAGDGVLMPVNYNSPEQTVISGSKELVLEAMEKASAEGAKRAIELSVSGAFHTPFMKRAYEGLKEYVSGIPLQEPLVPVMSNVTAEPMTDVDAIRHLIVEQVINPVRWTEIIKNMINDGFDTFIEVGAGRVLSGLLRRIDRNVQSYNIDKAEDIEKIKNVLK